VERAHREGRELEEERVAGIRAVVTLRRTARLTSKVPLIGHPTYHTTVRPEAGALHYYLCASEHIAYRVMRYYPALVK
jgi:hypothetical protein